MPAKPRNFVGYYRVSTQKQGQSGLGPEAQQAAVGRYLAGLSSAKLSASYTEVESGKRADRPELAQALALCRASGATLIVAKLDRLSRDVDFLRQCVRDAGEAGILFADLRREDYAVRGGGHGRKGGSPAWQQ